MCLDASGDPTNYSGIIIWGFHNGNNQKWKFVQCGPGIFNIISLKNGAAIQIPGGNTSQGTQVFSTATTDNEYTRWRIERFKTGYSVKAVQGGLAFNVRGGACNQGDKVGLWGFGGNANDIW